MRSENTVTARKERQTSPKHASLSQVYSSQILKERTFGAQQRAVHPSGIKTLFLHVGVQEKQPITVQLSKSIQVITPVTHM